MNFSFTPPEGVYLLHDASQTPPCVTTRDHSFKSFVTSVEVPKGFKYDMASIPSWLLWMFPPLGRHQRAALYHDYLYQAQYTTRATADSVFREILEYDHVDKWRIRILYLAVRAFGWIAWEQHKNTASEFCYKMAVLKDKNKNYA